jgi:hypothetical protein
MARGAQQTSVSSPISITPGQSGGEDLQFRAREKTRRGRRRAGIVGIVVIVVIIGLVAPTAFATWAPLLHWTCEATAVTNSGTFFLPLALVNSPYGGGGFVNSTYPSQAVGFPPSWAAYQMEGGGESNGSIWGAFVWDTVAVSTLSNASVFGPGTNNRCVAQFSISFHIVPAAQGGGGYGGEIFNVPWGPDFGTGAMSDIGEPLLFNFSTSPGNSTSVFRQGFYGENEAPITTCNGPSQSISAVVNGVTTWVSFSWNGRSYTVPAVLPLTEDFHFVFPADFGTWEVDNLSAPGGPGGGWAFSYSPCSY